MLHPVLAEVVSIEGGPPLLQPIPEELINSPERVPLLPPIPQIPIDLEEVELSETETVGNLNPGVLEEFRPRSGANHTPQVTSLDSMNSFISGLQRLHGMLEFLRPTSDRRVGPVRARRSRRSSASRRARAGGSQRTNSAR
jgi:E3 ubiquitin-protein ligase RFWD3